MRVGIIGGGVVGNALYQCYKQDHEVKVYDALPGRSTHQWKDTIRADVILLCLPTPQRLNSLHLDTSAIEETCNWLQSDLDPRTCVVVKSTVPVGTTRSLRERYGLQGIIHSPEFLTARTAEVDAKFPRVHVLGKPGGFSSDVDYVDNPYYQLLGSPACPVFPMSSDESEMMKLVMNGFFAVKVAYFNEVKSLVEKLRLDWNNVLDSIIADGRISALHTQVPGPDGKYGFGGACLPKDLGQLITELCLGAMEDDPMSKCFVTASAYVRNLRDRNKPVTKGGTDANAE